MSDVRAMDEFWRALAAFVDVMVGYGIQDGYDPTPQVTCAESVWRGGGFTVTSPAWYAQAVCNAKDRVDEGALPSHIRARFNQAVECFDCLCEDCGHPVGSKEFTHLSPP